MADHRERHTRRMTGRPPPGDFDPVAEAVAAHAHSRALRRPRYSRSRLDRYAHELLALRDQGFSTAELQRWLRQRRVKVAHSTVGRWLRRHAID